jgi:outer membrane protein OmpA-like peptidoglycan-associated protein
MGPTGMIANWASYRDFWFDQNMTQIHEADRYLVSEIATYMRANPTLELGIDASTNPRATAQRDLTIRDNRVNAIRSALIAAGVPANRISAGQFGNVDQRRDGRVEILLRTDRQVYSQAGSAGAAPRPSDTQAQIGIVEDWTFYQSFWFDADESSIHTSDRSRVAEIAAFMRQNPLLQLGIDSSVSPSDPLHHYDRELATRRGNAVRNALIAAGVPASRIQSGEFSQPDTRRNGRVAVLIKTDRLAQAR